MVHAGFRTDSGRKRRNNEDSYFILPGSDIYMVADGVGGHNSGERASRMAVGNIAKELMDNKMPDDESELRTYFLNILSRVNTDIWNESLASPENSGMATTLVMTYIRKEEAYFINVGDSRGYVIRDGKIEQITKDHTVPEEEFERGYITREELKYHPDRHKITRALGGEMTVKPDFYKIDIRKEDIIILCTDGLYGELDENEILDLTDKYENMADLSRELVNAANRKGGADNITVITLKV